MRVSRQALRGRGRSRPERSYLSKVIRLKWRDSFQDDELTSLKDLGDDCIWESFGTVIRESDLFITIAFHRELTDTKGYADVLSVPWTQVIDVTVLDTDESFPPIKRKHKIHVQHTAPEHLESVRNREHDAFRAS